MLYGDTYIRLAGSWAVHYKRDRKGVLRIHEPKNEQLKHLHRVRLIEVSKEHHDRDNKGYL
jgi:hypothetical protein